MMYSCAVFPAPDSTLEEASIHKIERICRKLDLRAGDHVLETDYRELSGTFDKLVSIEMIEAVGHRYYDAYFRRCSALLKPDGLMALQAITITDWAYRRHVNTVDFIKRYIFPGGCLPSVAAIADAVARVTDLRVVHLEDIGPHYVRTRPALVPVLEGQP